MRVFYSKLKFSFSLLVVVFLLSTCTEDEEKKRDFPRVQTLEVESITEGGAVFKGEIRDYPHPITERGFKWSVTESFVGLITTVNLGPASGDGSFEATIDNDLIPDKVYYVWAYAKTATHTVNGEMKSFRSLGSKAPVVESFQPKELDWGDTIAIAGKYFTAERNSVQVEIGGTRAKILTTTQDRITAVIPEDFNGPKGRLAVSVFGNIALAKDSLILFRPVIQKLSPESGFEGQELIITGDHFHPSARNKVTFNSIEASIITHSKTMLKCLVPEIITGGEVSVQVTSGAQTSEVATTFTIIQPAIVNVNPLSGTFGDLVRITFNNLSFDLEEIQVLFGASPAEVVSVTANSLVVRVPGKLEASNEISVSYFGTKMTYPDHFQMAPPIIDRFDPVVDRVGDVFIVQGQNFDPSGNNRVFVGGHQADVTVLSNRELLVSVPVGVDVHEPSILVEVAGQVAESSDKLRIRWIQNSLPSSYRVQQGSVFQFYKGNIFKTLGNDYPVEFTAYDVSSRYLRKLKSFAGTPRQNCASFILDGKLYVMGGYVYHSSGGYYEHFKDVWVYDFAGDSWIQKKNLPFDAGFSNLTGFAINGSGYLIRGSHVYRYESITDEWIVINSDAVPGYGSTGAVAGEYYYFKPINIHASNQVDRYDPVSNSWISVGEFDVFDQTYYAFAFNGMPVFGSWYHFSMYYNDYGSWVNYLYPGNGKSIRYAFEHNNAMNFLVLTPSHDYEYFSFRPDF